MIKKFVPFLLTITALSLMVGFWGCSKDDNNSSSNNPPTHEPQYSSGQTGADGNVSIPMSDYNLDVHVEDTLSQAINGAEVLAFQGQNVAVVWVEGAGYYSAYQVVSLAGIAASSGSGAYVVNPGSERGISGTDVALSFDLAALEGFIYDIPTDPPNIADLYDDGGFQEHSMTGTLADIYQVFSLFPADVVDRALRIYGSAAELRGTSVINAILSGQGLYEDLFYELVFDLTGLVPTDSVAFSYYSMDYNNETFYLPQVHISALTYQSGESDYKFILTWGQDPSDLDSYLWTPDIEGSTYQVWYGSRGSETTAPYAWLDVDDVTSYGPEVMTIVDLYPGTYTYAVNEYYGNGTITTSGAQVQVFHGRDLIGTYSVPTTPSEDYWWWYVGTVDGATGDFTLINTIQADPPVGSAPASLPAKAY
jgi:hypothetical protein